MDKQQKVGAIYQSQTQIPGIADKANGFVYECLKGGLEVGLGVLRGIAAPFVLPASLRKDYLPLPGTYGIDGQSEKSVNRSGEVWRYRIGTGIGVLADAALIGWAVTGGLDNSDLTSLAYTLAATNVGTSCYQLLSTLSDHRSNMRYISALSIRKGVGAPKLRE
tara:strand:- start:51 stop:542 length:492 start_codon:yes stop_codon:yes gene_type:complete